MDGVDVRNLNLWYGEKQALENISLLAPGQNVTALIGPSGCGKSTLLRCFNRMNDEIRGCRTNGQVLLDGADICSPGTDLISLRRRVGMVFQKANPFPFSIYENVAYGCRCAGIRNPGLLDEIVETSLRSAALYNEVKDRMDRPASQLSGGQQQRLCIARALAMRPEVILFDEPCSALDPIATTKIEDLIKELSRDYTIIIVTHNMQQARRIADMTAFLYMGTLVEFDETKHIFETPRMIETEKYVTGRFG